MHSVMGFARIEMGHMSLTGRNVQLKTALDGIGRGGKTLTRNQTDLFVFSGPLMCLVTGKTRSHTSLTRQNICVYAGMGRTEQDAEWTGMDATGLKRTERG